MYRAVALALTRADVPFSDAARVVEFLAHTRLEMPPGKVLLNGEDVSEAIRHPSMSDASSRVAVEPHVRGVLVQWQRQVARGRDMVCEGRDQGSVVFADSPCKFYLTASNATRAARRVAELKARGVETTPERVMEELEIRDHRDRTRAVGPLLLPENAIVVNTDGLTPEQVIDRLEAEVRRCRRG
jgi:cytidylate kinase